VKNELKEKLTNLFLLELIEIVEINENNENLDYNIYENNDYLNTHLIHF